MHYAVDDRDQLFRIERLDDPAGAAGGSTLIALVLAGLGGEDEDGQRIVHARGADVLDELDAIPDSPTIVDPADATRRKVFSPDMTREDLLEPVFRKGRLVRESPPIDAIRMRVKSQLEALHAGVKRFLNPHSYPVGLEEKLFNRRRELVFEARGHHIREVK